ncbi:MAG: glycosyltransferase family 2 protein [Thermomicrobiales bacterium]
MSTRFTVVIPTRERCDTLEWALKTCVTQEYDNLEILVSDNHSADRTEEVVRSFPDPRIRYLNTGRRLSMTENFEFALSHVSGGFVTCIGDDDGLVPHALVDLDRLITEHGCRVIIWPRQTYHWPQFVQTDYANTLLMNLFQDTSLREVKAAEMLRDAIGFRRSHYDLPSPYYGIVQHDLIRAVMAKSGAFFHSISPDIYSSVAMACVLDTYHFSSRAYALAGVSRHSNGATFMSGITTGQENPARLYLSENTTPFHPEVTMGPSIALLLAEACLQVRDHVGYPEKVAVDMRKVIRAAIEDENLLLNPTLYQSVVRAVEQTAALHGLEEYARDVIARYHYRSTPVLARAALRALLSRNLTVQCERYGVTNIYDASLLFDRLLRQYRSPAAKSGIYLANYVRKAKRLAGLAIRPYATRMGKAVRARR